MVQDNTEFDEVLGTESSESRPGVDDKWRAPEGVWMRGIMMLLVALLFKLAVSILLVLALVQFFWMLFTGEKNTMLVSFGEDLAHWLSDAARFLSGAAEGKPFPWTGWR